MAQTVTKGNCYLCGASVSKSTFKRHILSSHSYEGADCQECALFKVESAEFKEYWLFLDIPLTSTLKSLDGFLREIWLECCGHMSAFFTRNYDEVGMSRKIITVTDLGALRYQYDFGDTTELVITYIGEIKRPKQRKAVRLLGRNEPYSFVCGKCGEEAQFISPELMYSGTSPFLCEHCLHQEEEEFDEVLPVTNSPRMGVCGYCGELDVYDFVPEDTKK